MERLSSKITASNIRELKARGYYIHNEIGHGTYSNVFKAEKFDLKNKNSETNNNTTKTKYVAIKLINHRRSAEHFCQKFLPREIDVVRSITHKNIVETIEILMSPDSATYIITEYCMRGDLLNYICLRGALSETQSKSYFYDLISAVEYLHDIDVVHRDIKCENLLVHSNFNNNDNNPNNCSTMLKLADFGFSREIFENQLSTTFCGSPAYVAPEIIHGKPYNPRLTDIWSCGVVLYIMVNASMPFDDENLNDLLKQQTKSLKRTNHDISDDLYFFIEGLLTVNVRNRLNLKTIKNAVWYGNVSNNNCEIEKNNNNNQLTTS